MKAQELEQMMIPEEENPATATETSMPPGSAVASENFVMELDRVEEEDTKRRTQQIVTPNKVD